MQFYSPQGEKLQGLLHRTADPRQPGFARSSIAWGLSQNVSFLGKVPWIFMKKRALDRIFNRSGLVVDKICPEFGIYNWGFSFGR